MSSVACWLSLFWDSFWGQRCLSPKRLNHVVFSKQPLARMLVKHSEPITATTNFEWWVLCYSNLPPIVTLNCRLVMGGFCLTDGNAKKKKHVWKYIGLVCHFSVCSFLEYSSNCLACLLSWEVSSRENDERAVKFRLQLNAFECAKSEFPFMQNRGRLKRAFCGNGCCRGQQGFLVQINTGSNGHLGTFWYSKPTCILFDFTECNKPHHFLISCINLLTNSSNLRFEVKQHNLLS